MKKLLTLAIPLLLLVFVGCKGPEGPEGPTGPEGPAGPEKVYVLGKVENTGNVYVEVYFSPVIPWVTVNQETLDVYRYEGLYEGYYWDEYNYYTDSISVSTGDSIHLKVDYTRGIATASSRVPGGFEITSHDTSQTAYISVGSDLTVSWSTSIYADFYRVYFWLYYDYYDTLGDYRRVYFHKDTCVTSTSIIFPASQLFPADLDSVRWSTGGHFLIWAMNGPILEPGSEGNVTGDGSGFFWGKSYCGLDIEIEGTKAKAKREPSKEELMKKWFEKAKAMDPDYQVLRQVSQ